MVKSTVVDNNSGKSVASNIRTSSGTFLTSKQDDVIAKLEAKIAEELGKHTCVLLAEQREGDVDPDPAVPLTSKSPEGSEGPPTATKRLSPVTYWTSFQVSAGRKPAVYQERPSPTPGIISRL